MGWYSIRIYKYIYIKIENSRQYTRDLIYGSFLGTHVAFNK